MMICVSLGKECVETKEEMTMKKNVGKNGLGFLSVTSGVLNGLAKRPGLLHFGYELYNAPVHAFSWNTHIVHGVKVKMSIQFGERERERESESKR